jgi:hypothetical protein
MTKQHDVIHMLNKKMAIGRKYTYNEIREWGNSEGHKEGTLTSVLTKSKGTGAVIQDVSFGLRERVREITFEEVREYDRTHYVKQSNTIGVTQVLCDKVKALVTTKFTDDEVMDVLKVKENVLKDIKSCNYNVRQFNDMYRARIARQKGTTEEPKTTVPPTNNGFTESLINLRDAVDATIIAFTEYDV